MRVPSYTYAGGELDPSLWGRVDLNKYNTGLKQAENFYVGVEGGVFKRPGLYFVAEVKDSTKDTIIIPWRIADDDSYILEFGHEYVRFVRLGGQVMDGGVPLEVETPYQDIELRDLKYTFANDLMYIFHGNHAPRVLKRTGLLVWSLDLIDFAANGPGPATVTASYTAAAPGTYEDQEVTTFYSVSATLADGSETLATLSNGVDIDLGHRRNFVDLSWTAVIGAIQYTVYKGHQGIYGFIGYTEAGVTAFEDHNYAPSYDVVPRKTFEGFNGNPRTGEFYRQRFVYAATADRPQTVWVSRAGRFNELTKSIPSLNDDAIEFTLVGRNALTVNHLVELDKLILFTDTAEWILETGDGALTPSSADPRPKSYYGSDPNLRPVTIGPRVLFAENLTGVIRDYGYDFSSNSHTADDLTRLSRHLISNNSIISWTYGHHPYNMLWCARDDGTVMNLTYVREHEIWGWSRTVTDGMIMSVAAVSEINRTTLYAIVKRGDTQFIERMATPASEIVQHQFFVDCGLTYSNGLDAIGPVTWDGAELTFQITAGFIFEDNIIMVTTREWWRRFRVTAAGGTFVTAVPYDSGEGVASSASAFVFVCAKELEGFDHLEGRTVVALADGNVVEDLVVTGGVVTLPDWTGLAHVGLPYGAELTTLDLDQQQIQGRYPEKGINDITLRLRKSRGVFAGPASTSELFEVKPRDFESYDEPNRYLDGIYTLASNPNWSETAGVKISAPYPLPCQVLNIVPDLVYAS